MLHRSLNYIARAIAPWSFGDRFFNEPQRRRGHRARKERSHNGDFAGDPLFLTNRRGYRGRREGAIAFCFPIRIKRLGFSLSIVLLDRLLFRIYHL
ncbi:hypothetical protein [Nostoc sp.]|uniref:hypothetical protein n=1 Tax=Nostoc sp. TaxID=1180 RepID=UPI002FF9EB93